MMCFSYPIHDPVIPGPDSCWGIFFTRTVRLRSPILNREARPLLFVCYGNIVHSTLAKSLPAGCCTGSRKG